MLGSFVQGEFVSFQTVTFWGGVREREEVGGVGRDEKAGVASGDMTIWNGSAWRAGTADKLHTQIRTGTGMHGDYGGGGEAQDRSRRGVRNCQEQLLEDEVLAVQRNTGCYLLSIQRRGVL